MCINWCYSAGTSYYLQYRAKRSVAVLPTFELRSVMNTTHHKGQLTTYIHTQSTHVHANSEYTDLKEWFKFTYKHSNNSWIRIPTKPGKNGSYENFKGTKKTGNTFLWITNLTQSSFFIFVYSNSLHVSSNQVLIIRRVNCINTIAGICHCM